MADIHSSSPAPVNNTHWPQLWQRWSILKRIASTGFMAIAGGALACGVVTVPLTSFVNQLGVCLGIPIGLTLGGFLGFKSPARNSVLVVTGPVAALTLAYSAKTPSGANDFAIVIGGYALAAISVPVILAIVRFLPSRWTYWLAIADVWIIGLWIIHAIYVALFVVS